MAKRNVHLLVIDPQNDFCIPLAPGADPKTAVAGHTKGALVVAGADKDMRRLASFIIRNKSRIEQIDCSLDSHQLNHIAHPPMWVDSKGNNPAYFTKITDVDVKNGVWRSYNPHWQTKFLTYVETLKKNGRYDLTIWPPHCLIGTWGHSIVPEVAQAFYEWEADFNRINFVAKGSNMFTEHYSAVQADVIDDTDSSTSLNTGLIDTLNEADEIVVGGEALSHCIASTLRDVAAQFGPDQVKKFTLLEDACSSVSGFEKVGQDFVKEMVSKGMRITNTLDW